MGRADRRRGSYDVLGRTRSAPSAAEGVATENPVEEAGTSRVRRRKRNARSLRVVIDEHDAICSEGYLKSGEESPKGPLEVGHGALVEPNGTNAEESNGSSTSEQELHKKSTVPKTALKPPRGFRGNNDTAHVTFPGNGSVDSEPRKGREQEIRREAGRASTSSPPLYQLRLNEQVPPANTVGSSGRHSDWEQEHIASLHRDVLGKARVATSLWEYVVREVRGDDDAEGRTLQEDAAQRESKRERVYNTMFHVPWRCELLLLGGFLVCLDAFLALLTVTPLRLALLLWRSWSPPSPRRGRPDGHGAAEAHHHRQATRIRADELSDMARMLVLVSGVLILLQADVSLIYHWIRGQAIIKLYVIFNVLEILDKLCQSFGADMVQVMYNSADRVTRWRGGGAGVADALHLLLDEAIAVVSFSVHALVIMTQAIAINVAINSHNHALLTLLVSNNFAEVKGNVFKRLSVDNMHKMAHLDVVERFHVAVHLLFVLVQNLTRAEDPWLRTFALSAVTVLLCEMVVDNIKHAFLANFNQVKPHVYSQFLQALCKQTLQSGSQQVHRTLAFVPLAPAILAVRVVVPLLLSRLPQASLWWRATVGCSLAAFTFSLLLAAKAVLGMSLQAFSHWYLQRCIRKGIRVRSP